LNAFYIHNGIGVVVVSVLTSCAVDRGSGPDRVIESDWLKYEKNLKVI